DLDDLLLVRELPLLRGGAGDLELLAESAHVALIRQRREDAALGLLRALLGRGGLGDELAVLVDRQRELRVRLRQRLRGELRLERRAKPPVVAPAADALGGLGLEASRADPLRRADDALLEAVDELRRMALDDLLLERGQVVEAELGHREAEQ